MEQEVHEGPEGLDELRAERIRARLERAQERIRARLERAQERIRAAEERARAGEERARARQRSLQGSGDRLPASVVIVRPRG